MARPRKELDKAKIESLAAAFCTTSEIAAELGVGKATIERRYDAVVNVGKEKGRTRLRSVQFQMAMGRPGQPAEYLKDDRGNLVHTKDGKPIVIRSEVRPIPPNISMLIWLGKNYLNQSEKFSVTTDDGMGFGFSEEEKK